MSDLCDEQVIHDNIYANTYSLWGNSKYYDIKNLSPQNFANRNGTIGSEISQEFKASRWSSVPAEVVQAPEPPDSLNRRTVDRDSLYEDPEMFNKEPLMMQKMGWQGGALGRSGDGIVEPIAPNAVYVGNNAKTKIGFGQNHIQRNVLSPKHSKTADYKQFYEMNVLLNIYEFVKNNSEVELLFDKNLKKDERKKIHHLVQFKLSAEDLASVDFDNPAQMDLVLKISDKNCYILHSQSFGTYPIRQLSLFKIAPPHVYLIVPDKLKDHTDSLFSDEFEQRFLEQNGEEILEVEVEEPPIPEETKVPEELEPEEETNPFLISITRNLKKSDFECQKEEEVPEEPEVLPEMSEIMKKIVSFFTEFAETKKYSQFKFLGPFAEDELVAINEFIEQAVKYVSQEHCPFACVFRKVAFEINEDCTGNTVIYKRPVERKHRKN